MQKIELIEIQLSVFGPVKTCIQFWSWWKSSEKTGVGRSFYHEQLLYVCEVKSMGFILYSLYSVTPCPNCSEEILPSLAKIGCKLEYFIEKVMLTFEDLLEERQRYWWHLVYGKKDRISKIHNQTYCIVVRLTTRNTLGCEIGSFKCLYSLVTFT